MARILVVDDHEVWRELLTFHLERQGHSVATAENRKSAIDQIRQSLSTGHHFQLVTLDHDLADAANGNMGVIESQTILENLKDYPNPIGVLVISGRADQMDVRDYFRNYGIRDLSKKFGVVDIDFISKGDFSVLKFIESLASSLKRIEVMINTTPPSSKQEKGGNETIVATQTEKAVITRDKVFVSYSHKDQKWLEELRITLKPMVRGGELQIWDDQSLIPGQKWRNEIAMALASAKVAVLLVSRSYLASDFIADNELPRLLQDAEKEGVKIIWIPVSASGVKQTPLAEFQAAQNPDHPLDSLSPSELNTALVRIGNAIHQAFTT